MELNHENHENHEPIGVKYRGRYKHRYLFFGCTVPGYFFFSSFCFKRGFYCWVIILHFSSFSIILFAVDLSFPIFVSKMSVVVIFSFLSLSSDAIGSDVPRLD